MRRLSGPDSDSPLSRPAGRRCHRAALAAAAVVLATGAAMLPIRSAVHAACPPSSWQPNPPAGWHTDPRTVTDGQTTAGSPTLTSAAQAQFTQYDKGRGVTGTNIPANTTIANVLSATSVKLSATASASGSGLSITIAGKAWQNPSTALVTTPDGNTTVYTSNGFSPTDPGSGWVGASSSSASAAGVDGYAEFNAYGSSAYPNGYTVIAGDSPAGSGGVYFPGPSQC